MRALAVLRWWMVGVGLWAVPDARVAMGQESPARDRTPQVYLDRVDAQWFGKGDRFWYRRDLPGGRREFVVVEAESGMRRAPFDPERVARALGEALDRNVDPDRLPVDRIAMEDDGTVVRLWGADGEWAWRPETSELKGIRREPGAGEDTGGSATDSGRGQSRGGEGRRRRETREESERGLRSPDGRWEALVHGDNLWVREVGGDRKIPLTFDANPTRSYARTRERDRNVGMNYTAADPERPIPEVSWSPDSRRLVAMCTRPGTQRRVYLVDSTPDDQVQPRLESYPYLKPGDDLPISKPHLFEVESGREIAMSDALFANPWSIEDVRWSKDSREFTFLYNERGHQVLRVVAVDAVSGSVRSAVEDRSDTFICYSQKFFRRDLDGGAEMLWMSERDGWNHLYLWNAAQGIIRNQVTRGEWVVREVEHVDEALRQVWFFAGGLRPGQDPYFLHLARVNFDGTGLVILTEGNGSHTVRFSPDRRYFIDTWSRVDQPPVTELRRAEDGRLVCRLEEADAQELWASGWRAPEPFVAPGRDGITEIHGVIHRPRDFDPARKYPVIESIYAGPHSAFVPKTFRSSYRWEGLKDRGFVLVQIDGMGTSHRSKRFHDVCWKNLGDAGFPDRIRWMQAAAARYPWMDLSRVGIYGGSAGGQNALRAMLAHGDFYRAAAADCGCHDNRMDKIWWNEQWMGWPVGPQYAEQSNVTQAGKLQGALLLTVGELDRNVDPASTLQVVDALIQADKDFELIVFPGRGHGAGESPYGVRRRTEFFLRHLQGGH